MTDAQEQGSVPYEVGYGKPPKEHQFKPGESGNPGGKPKGASITAALLRELAKDPDNDGIGRGAVEHALELIRLAKGISTDPKTAAVQVKAISMLLDRADGPMSKQGPAITAETLKIILADRPEAQLPGTEG